MLLQLQVWSLYLLQESGSTVSWDPASLWRQMGPLAKAVVVGLFIMSAYSIGVMIDRLMAYSAARKQSRQFAPAVLRVRRLSTGPGAAGAERRAEIRPVHALPRSAELARPHHRFPGAPPFQYRCTGRPRLRPRSRSPRFPTSRTWEADQYQDQRMRAPGARRLATGVGVRQQVAFPRRIRCAGPAPPATPRRSIVSGVPWPGADRRRTSRRSSLRAAVRKGKVTASSQAGHWRVAGAGMYRFW